jgi:hypothetical protein
MILDVKQLPYIRVSRRVDQLKLNQTDAYGAAHIVEVVNTGDFDTKLLDYLAARARHRFTINEPAPFPVHELLRVVAERIERGDKLEYVHQDQFENDFDAAVAFNELRASVGLSPIKEESLFTKALRFIE